MRKIGKSRNASIEGVFVSLRAKCIRKRNVFLYIIGLVILFVGLNIASFFKDSSSLYSIVDELNNIYKITRKQELGEFVGEKTIPPLEVNLKGYIEKNDETVGFLTIPYIGMGLPVVQTSNNDYYLTHDFYKKDNELGWIFLDTRSYNKASEDNKVIYGHNVTTNNMFGNLKSFLNLTEKDLETEEQKLQAKYIYYNTENASLVYEIVSAYVTNYENWTYTQDKFDGKEKKAFIDMVKKENKVPAFDKVQLRVNDNLLTLSTCYGVIGTTKRLVIHAKLITEVYN